MRTTRATSCHGARGDCAQRKRPERSCSRRCGVAGFGKVGIAIGGFLVTGAVLVVRAGAALADVLQRVNVVGTASLLRALMGSEGKQSGCGRRASL